LLLLACLSYLFFPVQLFDDKMSTVLEEKDGQLLGASIAADGQWRFPEETAVPEKFMLALTSYEDRRFFYHPGIDLIALSRASWQNLKAKKVVSGGSTLSMQVARLSGKASQRTVWNKLKEMLLAVRIECQYRKRSILALYASHAPYGGNVVGIGAASWRYFGKMPASLSWAESATLAILPNAPALIHPGRKRELLLKKRNRLLERLYQEGRFDKQTLNLALSEPLPDKPLSLPREAPHLLDKVKKEMGAVRLVTTLDPALQQRLSHLVQLHGEVLQANEIHNAAAIVVRVSDGAVLAYVGNTPAAGGDHGNEVDVIMAPRSTGSILKPLLYAGMLDAGELLPDMLVADLPMQIGGFSPKNFNRGYDGAVPASRALERSLNVPSVRMLEEYGVERFQQLLKKMGMTTLDKPSGHYGLSLILGGGEAKLWELSGVYAAMARTLRHYQDNGGLYDKEDIHPPVYSQKENTKPGTTAKTTTTAPCLGAGAIYLTFKALLEVNRPDQEAEWRSFRGSRKIAWKTGTSFGFRDAWAIGTTPEYVVAVWAGNADGEGRPGLTGISAAAPLMFDIFDALPPTTWFTPPWGELVLVPVCSQSGYRSGPDCESTDTVWVPLKGVKTPPCPYHRIVHLDPSGKFRVNSDCEDVSRMLHVKWFVLPPAMEWYYKSGNPAYRPLPPMKAGCNEDANFKPMEFIFPRDVSKILIPKELDGKPGRIVFEAAHRNPGAKIHWYLDNLFLGTTTMPHQMAMNPEVGRHVVTLVDEGGGRLVKVIEVVGK